MCGGPWIIERKSIILGHGYILQNTVLFSEKGIRGVPAYSRAHGHQDPGSAYLVHIPHLCDPWFRFCALSVYGLLVADKRSGLHQKDFCVRPIDCGRGPLCSYPIEPIRTIQNPGSASFFLIVLWIRTAL